MGYWKRLAGEYLETHGVLNPPKDILEKIKPMTMTESAALFSVNLDFRERRSRWQMI